MTDSLVDKIADTSQALENRTYYAVLLFRTNVLAKMSDTNSEAGAEALKYVINESNTEARNKAIELKAKANALQAGMDRITGEWEHRQSVQQFLKKAPDVLASTHDYHKELAGNYSLRVVDAAPDSETFNTNRAHAVREHHASLAYLDLSRILKETFEPLFNVVDQTA